MFAVSYVPNPKGRIKTVLTWDLKCGIIMAASSRLSRRKWMKNERRPIAHDSSNSILLSFLFSSGEVEAKLIVSSSVYK